MTTIAGAIAIGLACDRCRDEPSECKPCDPVALLRGSEALSSGRLAAIDADVVARCAEHVIPEDLRWEWESYGCEELTAHYVIRAIEWNGDLRASWDDETIDTFACPRPARACLGASGPEYQQIVGPPELELEAASPVAMLVASAALPAPNEQALAVDLPELIRRALDGEHCELPMEVYEASCTAFLVGPRHVMTAKHCLGDPPITCGGEADDRLSHKSLVFDYLEHPLDGTTIVTGLTVVACGTWDGQATIALEHDWALIELDEPAPGARPPLTLPAPDAAARDCEIVHAVGHPIGHPQFRTGTIDAELPSAWVRLGHNPGIFRTTLDIIAGYSGAPVLAHDGDRLIGLVTSGDFYFNGADACDWIFQCGAAGCRHESEYGAAVDLAAIHDIVAPIVAAG